MVTGVTGFTSSHASDPQRISLYLSSRGWRPSLDAGGTVWQSHEDEFEVFVPKSPAMRGYMTYIQDMIRTLSAAEERSESQIALEISTSDADVQFIHTHPESEPGTTPIEEGVKAFESLRLWVLAGAVSASSPRQKPIQPTRKPSQALDFMQTVRLGPTLEGSYVLTVYIPIPIQIGQGFLELETTDPVIRLSIQPFPRKVSLTLREATREAVNAADEVIRLGAGIDSFTRRADKGVNANLCEAVAGMSGGLDHTVDINFSWSLSRPVEPTPPVSISPSHSTILREAARELRAAVPEEDVRVVGAVVRLHRDGSLGPGEVSVAGAIEGDVSSRLRRVWFDLPEPDYARATRAHEVGSTVSVVGNLIRHGNRHILQNPRGFEILPDVVD